MIRAVCLALVVLALPATASALRTPSFETPKEEPTWSLNVQLTPYRPRMTGGRSKSVARYFVANFAAGLANPTFGHGPLLTTVEVDYYFLHNFGRLGASLSVGHWNIEGGGRVCFTGVVQHSCTTAEITGFESVAGNTQQSLTVMPIRLSAVYRADQLLQHFDIPLMPYVRAGFNYNFWWARVGGNTAHDARKRPGEGGTWGFHATAGLAVNLNWLDPTESAGGNMLGMVGTHLFVEGSYIGADGFGAPPSQRLDLSDWTGSIGLTVDFR